MGSKVNRLTCDDDFDGDPSTRPTPGSEVSKVVGEGCNETEGGTVVPRGARRVSPVAP